MKEDRTEVLMNRQRLWYLAQILNELSEAQDFVPYANEPVHQMLNEEINSVIRDMDDMVERQKNARSVPTQASSSEGANSEG